MGVVRANLIDDEDVHHMQEVFFEESLPRRQALARFMMDYLECFDEEAETESTHEKRAQMQVRTRVAARVAVIGQPLCSSPVSPMLSPTPPPPRTTPHHPWRAAASARGSRSHRVPALIRHHALH